MTRARKATDIGVATSGHMVGQDVVGWDCLALRFDVVRQDENERIAIDKQRGELFFELGAVEADAGAGLYRSTYDPATKTVETFWSDQEEPGEPFSEQAMSDLRDADVDGVEP